MRNFLIRKIIITSVLIIFSVMRVCAYQVDISADNLEYDQNCGTISADGNVVLTWQGKKVYAEHVNFILEEKIMNASGSVKIEEEGNAFFAKNITYYFDDEKGEIRDVTAHSSLIFMRSESMVREDKNSYAVNNIKISHCDLDQPHTYFKAKRGKITLNERVTIYNPIFYIGKIPIFYLPIVTKSLKGGRGISSNLDFYIEPGYTSNGGLGVKSYASYRFSDAFKGKVLFDYYGSRGWGYGTEFSYFAKNAKGSIYAYNINDLSTGTERWTIRPYYWQRINQEWTLQSQAQFISDRDFNNMYNQSDWERNKNTLHSYASLTRQGKSSSLMMLIQRYDTYQNGEYETTSITLPQVNFTYYPKKIFFGLTNSFNLVYNNQYQNYGGSILENFFYKNTVNATYTLTRDFRFGRKLTLKPSIGIMEEWYDKDNTSSVVNNFLTRYFGSLNSRLRVTRWMDWNINYSLRTRTENNSLTIDTAANDYGIETSLLSFTNYMYIGNRTTVRNFFSYNFKDNRIANPVRWSPFITELTYTPKYYITAYLRQAQQVEPEVKFQSLQMDISIGELEKAFFNLGAFYQDYRRDELDNTLGFGLWLNPKWRLDYNIRTTMKTDGSYIKMNEHEFKIYRDLHCYNVGAVWKIRGVYHEVFFKFDIKTNMPFNRAQADKQYAQEEQIFYPWR